MGLKLKFFVVAFCGFLAYFVVSSMIELGKIRAETIQVKNEFNKYRELAQKVNEIDNKFTQDLANAKAENNKLYDNVINGLGRLQLNIDKATKTATTTSMDDANACELTGEARQNYYLLRDDIITKDKQILGLQDYIKNVCLAD